MRLLYAAETEPWRCTTLREGQIRVEGEEAKGSDDTEYRSDLY